MFQVRVVNGGSTWYLKSTTWTGPTDRADKFETREAAQAALDRAKRFMKARIYKAAVIEVADV